MSTLITQGSDHHHLVDDQERSPSDPSEKTELDPTRVEYSHSDIIHGATFASKRSQQEDDQPESLIGLSLPGGYRIDRALGSGGYGAVYAGTDLNLDRSIAIKLFTRDMESQAAQRFKDEGRLIAKLNHPNIIQVYAFNHNDFHSPFLVMERFGTSLKDHLRTLSSPLSLDLTVKIVTQILDALDAAHKLGVVHRDIKEANILFEAETERVKLCDFGIARAIEKIEDQAQTTREGFVIGTHHYIAPERYRGANHDARSDLYSVGVLFYRLLVGRRPFERYLGEVIPPAVIICRSLEENISGLEVAPRALARICAKLLATDLTTRYQDAESARKDLIEAFESPSTESYEHPQLQRSSQSAHITVPLNQLKTTNEIHIEGESASAHVKLAPTQLDQHRRLVLLSAFVIGSLISLALWQFTDLLKPNSVPKVIRLGSKPTTTQKTSPKRRNQARNSVSTQRELDHQVEAEQTLGHAHLKPALSPSPTKAKREARTSKSKAKRSKSESHSPHRSSTPKKKTSPFIFQTKSQ